MEIPYESWSAAIPARRSRRRFDPARPLEAETLEQLRRVCAEFRPFEGARCALVELGADTVFRGAAGSYGKVSGAAAFVAFIGDARAPHGPEHVGYTGEGAVLEATALGLGTCWVAGFFRPEAVARLLEPGPHERVMAVSPLGYAPADYTWQESAMSRLVRSHTRKPLGELVSGLPAAEWPAWARPALEAARLAPSAVNRQPWRFRVDEGAITVSVAKRAETGASPRLDCGIAMLHIEVAARAEGVRGTWDPLEAPEVARFRAL